uniref:Uncharacterized protein n=1 Tax=Brassica oleracea TaxID=3712 RepID=A0A3P6E1X3_BRAOL|nr:unnamed protein product [Brassica oleracea]
MAPSLRHLRRLFLQRVRFILIRPLSILRRCSHAIRLRPRW